MNNVLWVSRHKPLEAQIRTLEDKLGTIMVYQFIGKVPSAEYVVEVAKRLNAKYIIPVLPLSIIAKLVELAKKHGITVLWAEMEQVKTLQHEPKPNTDYDPECETVVGTEGLFKIMRFKRFHKIKAIRLELEPLNYAVENV